MLNTLSIRALKSLASSERLPRYSNLTKSQLVSALGYLEVTPSCELPQDDPDSFSSEEIQELVLENVVPLEPSADTGFPALNFSTPVEEVATPESPLWEWGYHSVRFLFASLVVLLTVAVGVGIASRGAVRAGRSTRRLLHWIDQSRVFEREIWLVPGEILERVVQNALA